MARESNARYRLEPAMRIATAGVGGHAHDPHRGEADRSRSQRAQDDTVRGRHARQSRTESHEAIRAPATHGFVATQCGCHVVVLAVHPPQRAAQPDRILECLRGALAGVRQDRMRRIDDSA